MKSVLLGVINFTQKKKNNNSLFTHLKTKSKIGWERFFSVAKDNKKYE
jgi:hypothetical protein